MLSILKGEKIICPKGHECGQIDVDIKPDDIIRADMLQLDMFESVDIAPNNDGHICKKCNEPISKVHDGAYSVLTKRGWIGIIPRD